MPDLALSLHDRDLGFLRILAERWGVDIQAPDARSALPQLVNAIVHRERLLEIIESLDESTRATLSALQRGKGRLPWAEFIRNYGPLREFGPGKRDRERPDLSPASPAEALWYRGLFARGFFDTPTGPLEFAYIPDDLLALMPPVRPMKDSPLGCPVPPPAPENIQFVSDQILDQACTMLAALRLGRKSTPGPVPDAVLKGLLSSAGLLDNQAVPAPEPTRTFLEASRSDALAHLFRTWLNSTEFNELRLIPGMVCEGKWTNDPLHARQVILALLRQVPQAEWWDLDSFVEGVRERKPDFQRPAGDYDSWFIRSESNGEFLRGFEHWNDVDGALIRFLVTGPLHWLGVFDLASLEPGFPPKAFRFSKWSGFLLDSSAPPVVEREEAKLKVANDGRLIIPRLVPRAVRYQVARFCAWEGGKGEEFYYRLTPVSLDKARKQGLRIGHLLAILRRYGVTPPPPALVRALEHWDETGVQARFEQVTVLRCSTPEILAALRSSKAARFLGDPLGPTSVIVADAAKPKVVQALVELGYLSEAGFDEEKV